MATGPASIATARSSRWASTGRPSTTAPARGPSGPRGLASMTRAGYGRDIAGASLRLGPGRKSRFQREEDRFQREEDRFQREESRGAEASCSIPVRTETILLDPTPHVPSLSSATFILHLPSGIC